MSLNCAEIDLVLKELDLEGAFIQQIVQPSYDTIALYVYKTSWGARTVLICLAPGACRIHETRRRIPKNDRPLRFMEFLRSRVKGSRIVSAVQTGRDRIVHMTLSKGGEILNMYIRLWSGAANIVVTDAGDSILDVFYRRPKRGEITGGTYVPPAVRPQDGQRVWDVRSFPGQGADTEDGAPVPFGLRADAWYAEHAESLSREALLDQAEKQYNARRSRMEAALARLGKKREAFLHAGMWKHQGDLILANSHLLKDGSPVLECTDYETGSIMRIPVDPAKKPQENAARYYEKYKKAVSGLADLEDDIAASVRALETLENEYVRLKNEENPLVMRKLMQRSAALQSGAARRQNDRRYPGLAFLSDGWLILVGRTAAENDELLRRHVKGQDMWLHVRDWSGGYVFIKARSGKTVPLDILLDAGTLALFYSKGRRAGKADLYYTQVKYLRRAKTSGRTKHVPRGTVLPSHEKNLTVELDDVRLKRLETCRLE